MHFPPNTLTFMVSPCRMVSPGVARTPAPHCVATGTRSYFWGLLTLCFTEKSIKKCDHESADRQTHAVPC